MPSITKTFIDYFDDISNKLSVYSLAFDHQIFHEKIISRQDELDWMTDIGFLPIFRHFTISKTIKAEISQSKKLLIEEYDNCVQLQIARSCSPMNEIIKRELNKIR
ncbi:MAG: hypothetical protein PF570_01635 [Candidatus Cloacimonetes bacterium]|nr:hypothetical protein [Candidatus Cloacimonadota bacterium]